MATRPELKDRKIPAEHLKPAIETVERETGLKCDGFTDYECRMVFDRLPWEQQHALNLERPPLTVMRNLVHQINGFRKAGKLAKTLGGHGRPKRTGESQGKLI